MTTKTPAEMTLNELAKDRADWLLDAIATATQDRRFLRGDPAYDEPAGKAILMNAEKALLHAETLTLHKAANTLSPMLRSMVSRSEAYRAIITLTPDLPKELR